MSIGVNTYSEHHCLLHLLYQVPLGGTGCSYPEASWRYLSLELDLTFELICVIGAVVCFHEFDPPFDR